MGEGLVLGIDDFRSLPIKKKLDCLYDNQLQSIRNDSETLKKVNGYRPHQKIQYPWLVALSGAAIFILKIGVGV